MSNKIEPESNYAIFRDCFSSHILKRATINSKPPQRHTRRNEKKKQKTSQSMISNAIDEESAEDMSDFLEARLPLPHTIQPTF